MSVNTDIIINSIVPQMEVETAKKDNLSSLKAELVDACVKSLIWGGLAYNYSDYNEFAGLVAGQILLGSKLAHLAQKRLGLNPSVSASVITGMGATLLYQFPHPMVLTSPTAWSLGVHCATLPVLAMGQVALYATATLGLMAGVAAVGRIGFLGAREFAKEVDELSAQIREIKPSQAEVNTLVAEGIEELEIA